MRSPSRPAWLPALVLLAAVSGVIVAQPPGGFPRGPINPGGIPRPGMPAVPTPPVMPTPPAIPARPNVPNQPTDGMPGGRAGGAFPGDEIPPRAKADFDKLEAEPREAGAAFAAGINYYLETHPETKPRLLTKIEPWYLLAFARAATASL